jgi:hypothetical protein
MPDLCVARNVGISDSRAIIPSRFALVGSTIFTIGEITIPIIATENFRKLALTRFHSFR